MKPPRASSGWVLGSGTIAVAMGVMNLATYGFTLVAARVLGPREYGQIAAAMGVLLILSVVSLGLQATAARRISSSPGTRAGTEQDVLAASYQASVAVGALTLLASPALVTVLRLELPVMVFVALAAMPLTLMGGQAGVLQGERRWLPLALVYVGMGLSRFAVGLGIVSWRPDAASAMAAVALAAFVPVLVGASVLRRRREPARPPEPAAGPPARSVHAEVVRNSWALLAFFALSNSDILVARTVLDDHQSGLYAGGLILTKAVLFLPQFVVVLVFPSMAADTRRRGLQSKALLLILAMGLAVVAAAKLLAPLAVAFVGGSDYAELEGRLWAFAVLGTLLAMIQLLVYGVVARQSSSAIFMVWSGLLLLLLQAWWVSSVSHLVAAMAGSLSVVLVLLVIAAGRSRDPAVTVERTGVRR